MQAIVFVKQLLLLLHDNEIRRKLGDNALAEELERGSEVARIQENLIQPVNYIHPFFTEFQVSVPNLVILLLSVGVF